MKKLRETLNQYYTNINLAPQAKLALLRYDRRIQSKAEIVAVGKKYAEDFEQAQMDFTRLEQELENARARRDKSLMKINENLYKAKAADTTVQTLKNQLPVYITALHHPSYLLKMSADQHKGCVAIVKDIVRH